jgi:hypothetical protein
MLDSTFARAVPFALAAAVLAPGPAEACGGGAPPSYTIGAVSPGAGASGVARDVGIIVTGVPSSPPGGPTLFADVRLIDAGSDEVVPLTSVPWSSREGVEQAVALHPVEPLGPQRTYRVEARPFDASDTPGETVASTFVTSEALLDPIVLSGEIEVSLRGADVDVVACGPCASDCATTGQRRALLADVRLPVASGGQGVYRATLHFSDHTPARIDETDPVNDEEDDEPHDIRTAQGVDLEPGEAVTVQQEIFEESGPYAACFTFAVWDPAGHVAQASHCLPSLSPDDIRALSGREEPLDVAADEDGAVEDVQSAVADSRVERSPVVACSFHASAPSGTPAWLALLLSPILVRRITRRR